MSFDEVPISPLTSLPQRILIRILDELAYKDLLSCGQVSKSLRRMIEALPSLQYKLELAAAGMEDLPSRKYTIFQKLLLLRQYRYSWSAANSSHPLRKVTGPVYAVTSWAFHGGIFAQLINPQRIDFLRPACAIRGITRVGWRVSFNAHIHSFSMDPYQELIIAVFEDNAEYYFSPLDMHTGFIHLGAAFDSFHIPTPHSAEQQFQIYQDKLVLLARWKVGECHICRFHVWNWCTGATVTSFDCMEGNSKEGICYRDYSSVTFLDNNHIALSVRFMASDGIYRSSAIQIIDLSQGFDAISRATSFHLPSPAETAWVSDLCVVRQMPPKTYNRAPFQVSQDQAAVAIRFTITDTKYGGVSHLGIFIPTGKLLSCLDRSKAKNTRDVRWEDWGPVNTRALCFPELLGFGLSGSQYADSYDQSITVYDFNQLGVLSDMCAAEDASKYCQHITKSSTLESRLLQNDLTTSLPYRTYNTGIDNVFGDAVMLSEDVILMLNEPDNVYYAWSI